MLPQEKDSLANDYQSRLQTHEAALKEQEARLKDKEQSQEQMKQQYTNLSRFILTSKSLEGKDIASVVQGIGIDEVIPLGLVALCTAIPLISLCLPVCVAPQPAQPLPVHD